MTEKFLVAGHGILVRADGQRPRTCHGFVPVSVRIARYNIRVSDAYQNVPKMLP
jgi:hypothetical protein